MRKPLLFELVGLTAPYLVRGGLSGIAILGGSLAILLSLSLRIARAVIDYGDGHPFDRRAVAMASPGVVALASLLLVILAIQPR